MTENRNKKSYTNKYRSCYQWQRLELLVYSIGSEWFPNMFDLYFTVQVQLPEVTEAFCNLRWLRKSGSIWSRNTFTWAWSTAPVTSAAVASSEAAMKYPSAGGVSHMAGEMFCLGQRREEILTISITYSMKRLLTVLFVYWRFVYFLCPLPKFYLFGSIKKSRLMVAGC